MDATATTVFPPLEAKDLPPPLPLRRSMSVHPGMAKSDSCDDVMHVYDTEEDAMRAAAEELELQRLCAAPSPPNSPAFNYGSDEGKEDDDYVEFVNVVDLTESSDDDVEDVTEEVRAAKVKRTLKMSAHAKALPKKKPAKALLEAVAKERADKELAAVMKASRKRKIIQHPTEAETRDKPVPRTASV